MWRQRDLTPTASYDAQYVAKYGSPGHLAATPRLNRIRLALVQMVADPLARVLDYGCGSGAFVEAARAAGYNAVGYDVAEPARAHRVSERVARGVEWDVVCFFDSLEHLPDALGVVRDLATRFVIVSVPECHRPEDAAWFGAWKHRRPGEHLWHFERGTLDRFFAAAGFWCVVQGNPEDAVRTPYDPALSNILTAVYRR